MSIPGIAVEAMRWWQIAECADMERALFPDSAWSAETLWSELARVPESRYYRVAVELAAEVPGGDNPVLGYAGLATVPPEADIQTIAVAETARRIGLGGALLNDLLAEAERRGCHTVHLEVAADNESAIALYRSRNFADLSRRRDYYGPGRDAIVMRRRRSPNDAGATDV